MFRRRPVGPRRRRPINKTNFRLRQAHQLMELGQFLRAAEIFEELAWGAQRLQIPRAPFLFIQAGRGYLLGGNHSRGFDYVKQGLNLLAESARWKELQRVSRRVIIELDDRELSKESLEIKEWLTDVLHKNLGETEIISLEKAEHHPVLPTHCPRCGGALDPGIVNWLDGSTAECLYCGSPVRAEG